jgi:hypothetical protein
VTTAPRSELPELPAPNPKATTATLAAGVGQTLDTAPRLAISDTPKPKTPVSGLGQPEGVPTGMSTNPVTPPIVPSVWQPQRTSAQSPTPTPPAPPEPGAAGKRQIASVEEGYKLLEQRHAMHQLQKVDGDQYTFQCLVPDRQNPATFHRYEATAPGDSLNAVRAVIEQIDRDGR